MKSAPRISDRARSCKEVPERVEQLHGLSLVLHPAPVLRATCRPVSRFDSTLRDLLQEMEDLMLAHAGIGLAGPQVAIKQRLLICQIGSRSLRLMNPEIREIGVPGSFTEGCLSLPGIYVTVLRSERIEVKGYDDRGRKRFFTATGLWARVIQHERDHLNGMLILDHGPPLAEGDAPVYEGPPASLVETPP